MNPNGIPSFSPGLPRRRGYPGSCARNIFNPERVASKRNDDATPLGLMGILIRVPRVARASQPWAERHYPVGVKSRRAPLVDRILAAKQKNPAADTSALEREIDQQVYALYGLTRSSRRAVAILRSTIREQTSKRVAGKQFEFEGADGGGFQFRRRRPRADGVSCPRLGKELRQIPHTMKDARNHNRLAPRLVEDQIVPEAGHRPGAHADKLAKAALGADVGVFGNELESLFRRVQQPVSRWQVVARDMPPVVFQIEPGARLDEVIHRRREPFLCSP